MRTYLRVEHDCRLSPDAPSAACTATYAGETLLGTQGDPGREMAFHVVFSNIAQVLQLPVVIPYPGCPQVVNIHQNIDGSYLSCQLLSEWA